MQEIEPGKVCPKCGKQMDPGYMPDQLRNKGLGRIPIWVSGKPEKSFFGGIDLDGKDGIAIQTYRCLHCGYLESYALPAN